MKYYKIIRNNEIIGAVNSHDFFKYQSKNDCFERVNETKGEYVDYKGVFYRDTWLKPTTIDLEFTEASILEINEDDYYSFLAAIATNETIPVDPGEPQNRRPYQDVADEISLEYIKSAKLTEMSNTCHQLIEAGFDITLTDGQTHHFSLDTQDQLNLITLSAMADTQELVPYHADGEVCKFYTSAEIKQIIAAATQFKIYHTTYYNALKQYINSLNSIEAVSAITYGTELPEEYQSDVFKAIT